MGGKCFSHAERGGTVGVGVVLTRELEVLAILKWGVHEKFLPEGGRKKFYPVLRGGAKGFRPAISPF